MIDISAIVIPSEYLVALVITGLIMGVLFGYWISVWLHEKAADKKVAEGKIASTSDLPYNKYYITASVVGTVVGGLIGVFATPVIIQNFIIGGGIWTYVGVCALFVPIFVTIFVLLFHWGIRLFIVRAKDYAYILKEEGEGLVDGLTESQKQAVMSLINSFGQKKQ